MGSSKINRKSKKYLFKIRNKNHSISLGAIAVGVLDTEPLLSPENLEKDLEFVKNIGFSKITIFRLGGLNKEYIKILKKFVD